MYWRNPPKRSLSSAVIRLQACLPFGPLPKQSTSKLVQRPRLRFGFQLDYIRIDMPFSCQHHLSKLRKQGNQAQKSAVSPCGRRHGEPYAPTWKQENNVWMERRKPLRRNGCAHSQGLCLVHQPIRDLLAQNNLRQVLKITFAAFLAFSWAGFAYFLKEHSELCDWKSKRKMPDKSKKTAKSKTRNNNWTFAGNF